jgi:Lar family restriction alleviation protein
MVKRMDKLKPCPFCGGEAVLKQISDRWTVHCSQHCAGTRIFNDKQKAIDAWNRRVDARQLALKTRVCPMCEDCPDGCPVETPKDSRNIVTNADRIRSMSDEELARFLGDEPPYFSTYDKYLKWLQQPVDAKKDGWRSRKVNWHWEDWCPKCEEGE